MKTYEYKTLDSQGIGTSEVNEWANKGWRIINISWSDGGNMLTILMEKETNEMTQLEFEKANGEMKNRKVYKV